VTIAITVMMIIIIMFDNRRLSKERQAYLVSETIFGETIPDETEQRDFG